MTCVSPAVGVSPLAWAGDKQRGLRVSVLCWERVGEEGWERTGSRMERASKGEGGLGKGTVREKGVEPPGSIGGVKLLSLLQMPAPHQPSCRSRRAAGSTCCLRTTFAAQHPPAHQPRHPPRGWLWPLLPPFLHPTIAWRVPWAPGAAATALSAGRSPPPPAPRTTTRLTVPGAGPGRWKTNIPSTDPPMPRGWMVGGCGTPVPLTAAPASLPPPATSSNPAAMSFLLPAASGSCVSGGQCPGWTRRQP